METKMGKPAGLHGPPETFCYLRGGGRNDFPARPWDALNNRVREGNCAVTAIGLGLFGVPFLVRAKHHALVHCYCIAGYVTSLQGANLPTTQRAEGGQKDSYF